jgi:predicted Zn-dependent protease
MKGILNMIKKFLLGIIAVFVFVFAFANVSQASSQTYSKGINTPHWQKKPIHVYIPQDEKSQTMKNAFSKWSSASSGKLSFTYTSNEKEKDKADIIVNFTDKAEGLETKLGGYSLSTNGNQITKGTITIASKSKLAKKYSNDYIYTTMLHEVGHVIGMSDNQRRNGSIMSMPISERQEITKNDIKRLYKVNNWNFGSRNYNK